MTRAKLSERCAIASVISTKPCVTKSATPWIAAPISQKICARKLRPSAKCCAAPENVAYVSTVQNKNGGAELRSAISVKERDYCVLVLSLIHISEPTRLLSI